MTGKEKRAFSIQLPRDRLRRVNLGQAFAEYDKVLMRPGVFVKTPAYEAATDPARGKCFFVGRRGTGKTALSHQLGTVWKSAIEIHPVAFLASDWAIDLNEIKDTRQPAFRIIVAAWKHAIVDEVLVAWANRKLITLDRLPEVVRRDRNFVESMDFDERFVHFLNEGLEELSRHNDKAWMKSVNRPKQLLPELQKLVEGPAYEQVFLIDRIDEAWDGSDRAVLVLTALLHACVELNSSTEFIRPLLFLRENIFERVRQIDTEFARLETCVVSLDWSPPYLLELIERRLQLPFNSRLPIGGPTWDAFFERINGCTSSESVFAYCQLRPRDVLTYCAFAVESATARKAEMVQIEDMQTARRRFSDSRLNDLGDEYSENLPQLQVVLNRFFGLAQEMTANAVADFIVKLVVDPEVQALCEWVRPYSSTQAFIELMYGIGFFGIKRREHVEFRSLGVQVTAPPPVRADTHVVIHPTYTDALNLQSIVATSLPEDMPLQTSGLILDLPEAVDLVSYHQRCRDIVYKLKRTESGTSRAADFEDIVGETIRLCFFRVLTNVEPQVRNHNGTVRRDWVAANTAPNGFWEMVRQRYNATQVIWECKNCEELKAEDFQQSAYYLTREAGRFIIVCFRGEIKSHYFEHIKRVASDKDGMIMLLADNDLTVFLRQASNGKVKESHIRELYDRTVRQIS